MTDTPTRSLSPQSLASIKRLDLRARMVVRGFLQGLHRSPLQGFSVQFSDHRRYNRGDDPRLIDWLAYAKTNKYFVKRYEAETNMTGYLVMDLSASMALGADESANADTPLHADATMSKFEYGVCLAASLTYLMTMQQDPVGLLSIGENLRAILPARCRRDHVGNVIASLSSLRPAGITNLKTSIDQLTAMLRHQSLLMIFSDLLPSQSSGGAAAAGTPDADAAIDEFVQSLCQLGHAGHDVIVFHILDRQEVEFDYHGPIQFEDSETGQSISIDADEFRSQYLDGLKSYRDTLNTRLSALRIDYVPLDTGMAFDKALAEYLMTRQGSM